MRAGLGVVVLLAACGGSATTARDGGNAAIGDGGATGFVGGNGGGGNGGGSGNGSGGSDGGTVVLPSHCPCPLGSYCDLASNSCKLGCLGDDQCPSGTRCDTHVYACLQLCDDKTPCANHMACDRPVAFGMVCAICEAPGDMGQRCDCAARWGNCNGAPGDGCETPLDSLTNCGGCGMPAAAKCYPDHDGDRHGVDANVQTVCGSSGCPSGTHPMGDLDDLTDCDDNDVDVHPMQTQFFTSARPSGSWDYDCSNAVEVEFDYPDACPWDCSATSYWADKTPSCGETAKVDYCYWDTTTNSCRTVAYPSQTQACH